MKIKKNKQSDDKVLIEVEATAADVNRAYELAELDFANSMGLRPENEKTIAQVAEEKMGITNLDNVIENGAIEALIPLAIDQSGLVPAYPPMPIISMPITRNKEFSFSIEIPLKPEYELTSYDPVEITMPPFTINEDEVDMQIKKLAEQNTMYVTADPKPLEKGDSCFLAIKCFEDGKELTGLTTDGRTYIMGEGFMPSEFDENIEGMEPGETRKFTFEGPSIDENYNPITNTFDCEVTLKEIQKPVEPTIDDEWIKNTLPMYKSLEDLRGDIRSSIEHRDREAYDNYKLSLVANALADRFEGKIADEIYMNARENLIQQLKASLAQAGKTWEQYLEENGGEQQVGMMLMLQTREMVVRGFVLDAIFRHAGLGVTDEDIERVCYQMNPQMNPKKTREQIEAAGHGFVLRESAERMKANKWAADQAIVTIQEV